MEKLLLNNNRIRILIIVLLFCVIGRIDLFSQPPTRDIADISFTVNSSGDKVLFSQGNLQYKASSKTWRFALNQWDYIGIDNDKISSSYDGWIDLFGWGTSGYDNGATCYQPWSISTNDSDYLANTSTGPADWGYNAISNGGNQENSGWRTLSRSEWDYVLNTRSTSSGIRFAKAKVNGVNGVILLPDGWQTSYYTLNSTNATGAAFTQNTINAVQWASLEWYGAVFLPAAGYRLGNSVRDVNSYGYYWSSTNTVDHLLSTYYYDAYCINFFITNLQISELPRYDGCSVRLVRPVQNVSYSVNATPIPAEGGVVRGVGTYPAGADCTLMAAASAGYHFVYWTFNGQVVSNQTNYAFTVGNNCELVANFAPNNTSTGQLSGQFTVGENSCVNFSQGNLQYKASTNTWHFAESQWDYIGRNNQNVSETYNDWIDLFCWGTSGYNHGAVCYQPWSTSTTKSDYWAYGIDTLNLYDQTCLADWGYNAVVNGGNQENNGWRTLTNEEWKYLFNIRGTASGIRFAKAQVNNVNGVILLPDDWSADYYTLNSTNTYNASFSTNIITATQWATLEQHGAVFLPAAGYRYGTSVYSVGSFGNYWSASCNDGNYAYYVYFDDGYLGASYYSYRYYGRSVRLVRPVENCSFGINATPSPVEGGAVSGAGAYMAGAECTLTATPSAGYTFTYWTKNGRIVSENATFTFMVDGYSDFMANFALDVSTGILNGMFTVGENVCVYFSQGNLQYKASTHTWRFAEKQWDYVGVGNSSISETYDGLIDLFGWGTSGYNHGAVCYQPWSTSEEQSDYYAYGSDAFNLYDRTGKADWGYNSIDNGGKQVNSGWRTLTKDEWNFVLNNRSTISGLRFARAKVNEVNGVILLPDDWQENYYYLSNTNVSNANFNSNVITETQWATLEQHGAIFLPAAGYRIGNSVFSAGNSGYYWSASYSDSTYAYGANASVSEYGRRRGQSVRLVRSVQNVLFGINVLTIPGEGGVVSGAGAYTEGAECTLTATANPDYHFVNWTENGVVITTDPEYSFEVMSNRTIVANFIQNSFEIIGAVTPVVGGTISGTGTYQFGESATLTASANEGYEFVNWTVDEEVFTENPLNVNVVSNLEVVAHFSPNRCSITATANPVSGGTVNGANTYNYNATATLTATATEGYTFVNWTEEGEEVSTEATYSFTVTGDRNLVANFVENATPPTANHWTPQSSGYAFNMTLTGVIQINGVEQTSDQLEVGAFCGDECRGSEQTYFFAPAQRYIVQLTVFGESGDPITFRLYDHASQQELDLASPAPLAFNTDGYGSLSTPYVLNFTSSAIHTTTLTQGWNWWSTYIELAGNDGLSQLENSLGEHGMMIKSRENGFAEPYNVDGDISWYGNLTSICNEQQYMIRTNADCEAIVTGLPVILTDHPITLNPGWSWIGFPCQQPVSVGTAMSGITPEGDDIVKGRNGYASYYAGDGNWYGTLNTLEPGQGYMYQSLGSTAKTLVYNPGRGEATRENITPEHNLNRPISGGHAHNMTVTAVVEVNGTELRSDGYELAAFVGDECRGSVKLMFVAPVNRYVAFLTVFGEQDEPLQFRLTDGTASAIATEKHTFSADGTLGSLTSPVVLRFGNLGVEDNAMTPVLVYPNPSDGVFLVEGRDIERVEVYNTLGQRVFMEETSTDRVRVDLSACSEGVYTLRVVAATGVTSHSVIKRN